MQNSANRNDIFNALAGFVGRRVGGASVNVTSSPDIQAIKDKYPKIGKHNFNVLDSRFNPNANRFGTQLEFYPADEQYNPLPGNPTIELFNKNLTGKNLENAVVGDMLHHLPTVDKQYGEIKNSFLQSMTQEQLDFAAKRYLEDKQKYGTSRSFSGWLDNVWSDAMIRGYVTPDENDEFRKSGIYTKEQTKILEKIKQYISE